MIDLDELAARLRDERFDCPCSRGEILALIAELRSHRRLHTAVGHACVCLKNGRWSCRPRDIVNALDAFMKEKP